MLRRSLVALALVGGLTTSFGFTPLSEAQTTPSDKPGKKQVPAAADDKINALIENIPHPKEAP